MEYFKAKTEFLDEAFRYIDEQYGGIDNFLTNMCGLTKEKRERLSALFFSYIPAPSWKAASTALLCCMRE